MIYDYKCTKCGNVFEITCKMSQVYDKWPCPVCQCTECERHHGDGALMMAIPPERIGRMRVPDGFKDVLKNIKKKAIGGHHMN